MGRVFEFVANTTDGVFAVDRRQTIVLWNPGASAMLGFASRAAVGKKCYEILRGRDADGRAICRPGCDAIESAKRFETSTTKDMAARTKRGHEVWLNVSTVFVPSRRGELSVLVHLFREVTPQHDLARIVREFADRVSQLSAATRARPPHGIPRSAVDLTQREREILNQLVAGVSTEVIAGRLFISPRTVRNHVHNILCKLGVHSRLEAVTHSIRNGLV